MLSLIDSRQHNESMPKPALFSSGDRRSDGDEAPLAFGIINHSKIHALKIKGLDCYCPIAKGADGFDITKKSYMQVKQKHPQWHHYGVKE